MKKLLSLLLSAAIISSGMGIVHADKSITFDLKGDSMIIIPKGTDYVEPGYTAADGETDVTGSITADTSAVNTSKSGLYEVEYKASDNSVLATRYVRVLSFGEELVAKLDLEDETVLNTPITTFANTKFNMGTSFTNENAYQIVEENGNKVLKLSVNGTTSKNPQVICSGVDYSGLVCTSMRFKYEGNVPVWDSIQVKLNAKDWRRPVQLTDLALETGKWYKLKMFTNSYTGEIWYSVLAEDGSYSIVTEKTVSDVSGNSMENLIYTNTSFLLYPQAGNTEISADKNIYDMYVDDIAITKYTGNAYEFSAAKDNENNTAVVTAFSVKSRKSDTLYAAIYNKNGVLTSVAKGSDKITMPISSSNDTLRVFLWNEMNPIEDRYEILVSDLQDIDEINADKSPEITLKGDETVYVARGAAYKDMGAQAVSGDGATDITEKIVTIGLDSINTSETGNYTVTYTVAEAGKQDTKTRTVKVVDFSPIVPVLDLEDEEVSESTIAKFKNTSFAPYHGSSANCGTYTIVSENGSKVLKSSINGACQTGISTVNQNDYTGVTCTSFRFKFTGAPQNDSIQIKMGSKWIKLFTINSLKIDLNKWYTLNLYMNSVTEEAYYTLTDEEGITALNTYSLSGNDFSKVSFYLYWQTFGNNTTNYDIYVDNVTIGKYIS